MTKLSLFTSTFSLYYCRKILYRWNGKSLVFDWMNAGFFLQISEIYTKYRIFIKLIKNFTLNIFYFLNSCYSTLYYKFSEKYIVPLNVYLHLLKKMFLSSGKKKVFQYPGSNPWPSDQESDVLTTEPQRQVEDWVPNSVHKSLGVQKFCFSPAYAYGGVEAEIRKLPVLLLFWSVPYYLK